MPASFEVCNQEKDNSHVPALDALLEAASRDRSASACDADSGSGSPEQQDKPNGFDCDHAQLPPAKKQMLLKPTCADAFKYQFLSKYAESSPARATEDGSSSLLAPAQCSGQESGMFNGKPLADLASNKGNESACSDVDSDGSMSKLARPCAECRLSRVRCSRELPCSRCTRLGLTCKLAPALQRGRPSKQARVIKMLAQAQHASVQAQRPPGSSSQQDEPQMRTYPLGWMHEPSLSQLRPQQAQPHSPVHSQSPMPLHLPLQRAHSQSPTPSSVRSGPPSPVLCPGAQGHAPMTLVPIARFQQLLKLEAQQNHLRNQLDILRLQLRQMGADPFV